MAFIGELTASSKTSAMLLGVWQCAVQSHCYLGGVCWWQASCPGEAELPGGCLLHSRDAGGSHPLTDAGESFWGEPSVAEISRLSTNVFACLLFCLAKRNIVEHMLITTPIMILRTDRGPSAPWKMNTRAAAEILKDGRIFLEVSREVEFNAQWGISLIYQLVCMAWTLKELEQRGKQHHTGWE